MRERPGDAVEQALVAGHRRNVEREDPTRLEPLAREPEELPRREVERHVRLVVGIDDDQVVALVRASKERPRVGVVHRQARIVLHAEPAPPDATDGRVELDPVHAGLGIELPECARDRAARVS